MVHVTECWSGDGKDDEIYRFTLDSFAQFHRYADTWTAKRGLSRYQEYTKMLWDGGRRKRVDFVTLHGAGGRVRVTLWAEKA